MYKSESDLPIDHLNLSMIIPVWFPLVNQFLVMECEIVYDDRRHVILNAHMALGQVNKKSKTAKITAFF